MSVGFIFSYKANGFLKLRLGLIKAIKIDIIIAQERVQHQMIGPKFAMTGNKIRVDRIEKLSCASQAALIMSANIIELIRHSCNHIMKVTILIVLYLAI